MLLVCVLGHGRSQGPGVSQTLLTFLVCRTWLFFFFFLEYLVCIISHSTVWKNCGEACRKPWVCYLSLRKWFFKKLLEKVDLEARQLWLDSQAHHSLAAWTGSSLSYPLQLLRNKVFANHYHPILSPPNRSGDELGFYLGAYITSLCPVVRTSSLPGCRDFWKNNVSNST